MTSHAPAVAASPEIEFRHSTTWRWYNNSVTWCQQPQARDGIQINTVDQPTTRVTFTNTRRWTTITDVHAVFWSIRSGITWARYTGDSGCCAITPVHMGTTTLQAYNFVSQCYDLTDATWELARWVDRDAYATVNGVQRAFLINAFAIQTTA